MTGRKAVADRIRKLVDLLWVLTFFGAVSIAFRLWFGLGATTNLTDQVPWGLWKIMNMVAGVALATGGFMVGFLVYVLRMERLRPLIKPAILVAFLGYGSSVFALFLDIGLPWRIWHPIVMWNEHSFLFEVAWCVMLYFTITIIELSPTILERLRLQKLAGRLHSIAPGVVIVGIALSSLHHSSLGSLFLVTPVRLHPLWYTTFLPVHFILSAMGTGLMVVVLAKILYSSLYDPRRVFGTSASEPECGRCGAPGGNAPRIPGPDVPLLSNLAAIAGGVLAFGLALRLTDLFRTGAWRHFQAPTWEVALFSAELLLLYVIPLGAAASRSLRESPAGLVFASVSAAGGLLFNRMNVGIFGYFRDAGQIYVPSLAEWALSLGVVAAAGLVFLFVSQHCAVFDEGWEDRLRIHRRFDPAFDKLSGVWYRALRDGFHRTSLLAVLVLPAAWIALYPPFREGGRSYRLEARPPVAVDAERTALKLEGRGSAPPVVFKHLDHQKRLGQKESCGLCHHVSLPRDHNTPCSRCHRHMEAATDLFDHASHLSLVAEAERMSGRLRDNRTCGICHRPGEAETKATAKPCLECHRKDMSPRREPQGYWDLASACGYRRALHKNCIACHRKEAERSNRPALQECGTCHPPYSGEAIPRPSPSLLQTRAFPRRASIAAESDEPGP